MRFFCYGSQKQQCKSKSAAFIICLLLATQHAPAQQEKTIANSPERSAAFSANPAETANPDPLIILQIAKRGNVRALPDTSAIITDKLNPGVQVFLLGSDGDWFFVQYPVNQVGWIHRILLSQPIVIPDNRDMFNPQKIYTLYAGPGNRYPQLGKLFPLQRVAVIRKRGDWRQIRYDRRIAWIYISNEDNPRPGEMLFGIAPVSAGGNVREYPTLEAAIVGKVKEGDSLYVLEKWNDWYRVVFNNRPVYIHAILLQTGQQVEPLPLNFLRFSKAGNLRAGPGLNYPTLGQSKPGQYARLLKKTGDWNYVFLPDSVCAWVHDILVRHSSPPQEYRIQLIRNMDYLLRRAHSLRREGNYQKALDNYIRVIQLAKKQQNLQETGGCYARLRAEAEYAVGDKLYYPISFADNPALAELQNIGESDSCAREIRRSFTNWQKGFELHQKLLGLFSAKTAPPGDFEQTLNQSPEILPLSLEAEARRLIGRYYSQSRQNFTQAASWQNESAKIYRQLDNAEFLQHDTQYDNYFNVLLELAQNYLRLEKPHQSMAVLDEAYQLVQKLDRDDYLRRYLQVVNAVTDSFH